MTRASLGRAQRLQRIHDAALELLSERGFFGFHLRDVARASGSSPASFYHYFRDKQDLVYQVLRQTLEGAVASAEAAGTLGTARECLRALVTSHIQQGHGTPPPKQACFAVPHCRSSSRSVAPWMRSGRSTWKRRAGSSTAQPIAAASDVRPARYEPSCCWAWPTAPRWMR